MFEGEGVLCQGVQCVYVCLVVLLGLDVIGIQYGVFIVVMQWYGIDIMVIVYLVDCVVGYDVLVDIVQVVLFWDEDYVLFGELFFGLLVLRFVVVYLVCLCGLVFFMMFVCLFWYVWCCL